MAFRQTTLFIRSFAAGQFKRPATAQKQAGSNEEKNADSNPQNINNEEKMEGPQFPIFPKSNNGSIVGGLILIVLGGLFLLDNFFPRIHFFDLWPLVLIGIGAALIINSRSENKFNRMEL